MPSASPYKHNYTFTLNLDRLKSRIPWMKLTHSSIPVGDSSERPTYYMDSLMQVTNDFLSSHY